MRKGSLRSNVCSVLLGTVCATTFLCFVHLHHNQYPAEFSLQSVMNDIHYDRSRFEDQYCINGHISGWHPICEPLGCLRLVNATPKVELPRTANEAPTLREDVQYQIMSTIGDETHRSHLRILAYLTDMQWVFGNYGSIGEIGVYYGKFSIALVLNLDLDAGERYFVIDTFREEQKLLFLETLAHWNFSVDTGDEAHRIRLWKANSTLVNKAMFRNWDLPAARLIHIDGSRSPSLVLDDLVKVACLVRGGAIVIIDDFATEGDSGPPIQKGIKEFFEIYGDGIFKPIMAFSQKLYMATSSHYQLYMRYIKYRVLPKFPMTLSLVTSSYFGHNQTFYLNGQTRFNMLGNEVSNDRHHVANQHNVANDDEPVVDKASDVVNERKEQPIKNETSSEQKENSSR